MAEISGSKLVLWIEAARTLLRRIGRFLVTALGITAQRQSRQQRKARHRMRGTINAVARVALDSFDLDEIATRSLQEILHGTDMDAGMVYLQEEGGGELEMVVQQGLTEKLVEEAASGLLGEGFLGRSLTENGTPVVLDIETTSCPGSDTWLEYGYRSFVAVPIVCERRVIGVIGLLSKRRQASAGLHSEILKSIGSTLGQVLYKALAYHEISGALVGMRRLSRMTCEAMPRCRLDDTLEKLAQAVSDATLALSSMIVLMDGQGHVVRRATFGYTRQAISAAPRLDAISLRVLQTKESVTISNPAEMRDSIGPEIVEAGFASGICLPLRQEERPLGTLWLNYEAPRTFATWELEQLQGLADRVATAIENAHLHSSTLEKIERYKALQEHCATMSSCTELRDVLETLADSARELLGAGVALVTLSGGMPGEEQISIVRQGGEKDGESGSAVPTVEMAEGLRPLALSVDVTDAGVEKAVLNRMQGLLGVRLLNGDKEPVGILMVGHRMQKGEFTEDDAELLDVLAKHGMIAVENARAYHRAEHFVEEYRSLLDGVPIAIANINREQVFTAVNMEFEELTGFTREEVEGKMHLSDLLPEIERQGGSPLWEEGARDSLNGQELQAALATKEGDQKTVRVLVGATQNGGYIALCLTELEEREGPPPAVERQAAAPLQATAVSILAGLHDHVSAAADHLKGLLRREWPEETREYLDAMSERIRACRRMLEEFKVLSEPRPLAAEPVSLNDLITELADERAEELRRDTVGVVLRLDANLPAVSADREQLRWALGEVIENCRQAMRGSREARTLTVQTERKGDAGRMTIRDTRPGIPPEKLEELFELPMLDGEGPGEGSLTLAACRAIIERHGWRIFAESSAKEGIALVVEYPVGEERIHEKQAQPASSAVEAPPGEVSAAVVERKVLVIDDEAVVIDLLDYYLRSEGHKVETSRDGRDALSKLKEKDYDLIFCDLKLPGLSGQELFHWLELNKPELSRRVIFITGDVATPETLAFLKKPQKRWLEKPFDLSHLRLIIAEVLDGRRSLDPDIQTDRY